MKTKLSILLLAVALAGSAAPTPQIKLYPRQLTLASMQDVVIDDEGTIYAAAYLELESFFEKINEMKKLDARLRDYLKRNFERVFADIRKETVALPGSSEKREKFPRWLCVGSGVTTVDGLKIILGVGSVSGIKNMKFATVAAQNRARAELSKLFEVYSARLMRGYMASTAAEEMSASSVEQCVASHIKTLHESALSAVVTGSTLVSLGGRCP